MTANCCGLVHCLLNLLALLSLLESPLPSGSALLVTSKGLLAFAMQPQGVRLPLTMLSSRAGVKVGGL